MSIMLKLIHKILKRTPNITRISLMNQVGEPENVKGSYIYKIHCLKLVFELDIMKLVSFTLEKVNLSLLSGT